jgi:(1->4)-alpha-D-glucan 1-alpha-D-glucosylmutase
MPKENLISDERIKEIFEQVASNLPPRLPVSTYRVQFNNQFRFSDAKAIIPYLHALGITDIYASPYFAAQKGSMHGYDITDHNRLNPELGTNQDYEDFTAELKQHGMGQILDIVPNHMSIEGNENKWWTDVLENGPSSPYASFFDIDWKPVKEELENTVILPILGDQYGRVLENQELKLVFEKGSFFIDYYSHRLPVDPTTYTHVLTHRVDDLEASLGNKNQHFQELLSILTALKHLPGRTETDHEKITERQREKEIIKKRLWNLYNECPEFKTFIDKNVRIFNGEKNVPESFELLDALLSAQVYRLAFWQVATEEINYRRFFDINNLAAIRMEDPEVFRKTHRLIFRLIREGKVTGLRIDHPDGLYNPTEYFRRLEEGCFIQMCMGMLNTAEATEDLEEKFRQLYRRNLAKDQRLKIPFYTVGEKILIDDECIPENWPIFGTTGYVFMNSVNGVFVNPANVKALDNIYSRFIGSKMSFSSLLYEKKKLIMKTSMSSEINVLGHSLNRISEKDRHYRDFTLNNLIDAIVEVIAFFPVYRTYIDGSAVNDRDRHYIETAVARAKRHNRALSSSIFDFLRDILLLQYSDKLDEEGKKECLAFTMKFQQLTGPVMAKGLEDTVFYVYNRLVSLNEVGGNPDRFGTTVETFHKQNKERGKRWPYTIIATSTHDSKRSEDVRARINVLSELPSEWKENLMKWSRINKKKKSILDGQHVPDKNEEYLFYQTLIGAWPVHPMDKAEYETFKQRIKQYMLKAVREAKVNTNWINPNLDYENALIKFIEAVMDSEYFLEEFTPFQRKVSHYGMFNSLSQTLLKITSPGIPDFYQGTELWNLSLVDPDNRSPVDYSIRAKMLEELKKLESETEPEKLSFELTRNKEDGRIKLYLTYKALNFRKANRELFHNGEYIPLQATGNNSAHILAFARAKGASTALTIVPRLLTGCLKSYELPLGDIWKDTYLLLPEEMAGSAYRNIFTGQTITPIEHEGKNVITLSDVFSSFPVALLENS